jgi:hypothetical protein
VATLTLITLFRIRGIDNLMELNDVLPRGGEAYLDCNIDAATNRPTVTIVIDALVPLLWLAQPQQHNGGSFCELSSTAFVVDVRGLEADGSSSSVSIESEYRNASYTQHDADAGTGLAGMPHCAVVIRCVQCELSTFGSAVSVRFFNTASLGYQWRIHVEDEHLMRASTLNGYLSSAADDMLFGTSIYSIRFYRSHSSTLSHIGVRSYIASYDSVDRGVLVNGHEDFVASSAVQFVNSMRLEIAEGLFVFVTSVTEKQRSVAFYSLILAVLMSMMLLFGQGLEAFKCAHKFCSKKCNARRERRKAASPRLKHERHSADALLSSYAELGEFAAINDDDDDDDDD